VTTFSPKMNIFNFSFTLEIMTQNDAHIQYMYQILYLSDILICLFWK